MIDRTCWLSHRQRIVGDGATNTHRGRCDISLATSEGCAQPATPAAGADNAAARSTTDNRTTEMVLPPNLFDRRALNIKRPPAKEGTIPTESFPLTNNAQCLR